jgi:hypothetical protein
MATNTNHRTKTADDLVGTVRAHTEASIKDAQDLATATVGHTREVANVISRSALDSASRGTDVVVEAWKAWTSLAVPAVANPDVSEVVSAGFDMAGGLVEAQRLLAQRLIGAASPTIR